MSLVIGHRGAKGHYRENSLRSIRIAKELGCHIIEIDVRRSIDGIFFLQHDEKVEFLDLKTGNSFETRIEDEEYVNIIKWGYEQMLFAVMHITDKCNVYLDLKIGKKEENDLEYMKKYADELIKMLEDFENIGEKIYIASFNKILMGYLSTRYFDKKYVYGLILEENEELNDSDIFNEYYYFYGLNYRSDNLRKITLKIEKGGKYAFLYTINIVEEMKNLKERNIIYHGLISDFPDRVKLFYESLRYDFE
jgi:glycerophosphoryl diester phosphodiesterase